MDFQSRLLCTCMLGKDILRKKNGKGLLIRFFFMENIREKKKFRCIWNISLLFFFPFFQGFRIFFDHFHNAQGLKLQIAFKVGCNLWSNQKKSLCANVVNRIFMFNHLILFKSKSKFSLFQQETPIVTKCFFVGYFGYMWYSSYYMT